MKRLFILTVLASVIVGFGFGFGVGKRVTSREMTATNAVLHGIYLENVTIESTNNAPIVNLPYPILGTNVADPFVNRGQVLMRQSEWHKQDETWVKIYSEECQRLRGKLTALRIEHAKASGTLSVYTNATFKLNEEFWRTNASKFVVVKDCRLVGGESWYPSESQGAILDSVFVGKHPDDKE